MLPEKPVTYRAIIAALADAATVAKLGSEQHNNAWTKPNDPNYSFHRRCFRLTDAMVRQAATNLKTEHEKRDGYRVFTLDQAQQILDEVEDWVGTSVGAYRQRYQLVFGFINSEDMVNQAVFDEAVRHLQS